MALENQRTDNYGEFPAEKIYTCASCGGEIYNGDDCLFCNNGIFCRRCVVAMTSEDVVELLGFSFKTANEGDAEL